MAFQGLVPCGEGVEVSGHSRLSVVRSFPAKGNERSSTFLLQIREQKMRAEGGSLEDPEGREV